MPRHARENGLRDPRPELDLRSLLFLLVMAFPITVFNRALRIVKLHGLSLNPRMGPLTP